VGRRHVAHSRAFRVCLGGLAVLTVVGALMAPAVAKTSKPKAAAVSQPTLATLKILRANVTIKPAGKTKYVKAKEGQVLRQGDALTTDAAGAAEVDYTDGSLTRLGVSTQFAITKLTNKRGGRQTQGTLTVGETWNRAAKVAQTGSFEVKAGGATAAVEGTAFLVVCLGQAGQTACRIIDVVDNVNVATTAGVTPLTPATSVDITNATAGTVTQLTYDDLVNIPAVIGNVYLDAVAGKGAGIDELPPTTTTTTTTLPPRRGAPVTTQPPPEETTVPPPPPPPPSTTTIPPPTTTSCVPSNTNPC
jgi:hypothetical protein